MSDFTTPGRRSVSGAAGGGSSARRVVRSALELLAETTSPDLTRHGGDKHVRSESHKPNEPKQKSPQLTKTTFTVTRTTAPPPAPNASAEKVQTAPAHGGWAAKGEPSTLLFLSPQPSSRAQTHLSPTTALGSTKENHTSDRDSAVKKRLFKKKKRAKLSDSVKKLANRDVSPPVVLDESFSSARSDASPIRDAGSDCAPFTDRASHYKRGHTKDDVLNVQTSAAAPLSASSLLRTNEPLFTEDEVRARVAETLSAYEKRRDLEEESVLQEVGREIESQNARYDLLQRETAVISAERDGLREKVTSLASQCESLQSNVTTLHSELQAEREKSHRAEVQLCHSQDEQRLVSSDMQQKLSFEKAQWRLAQEEMRSRIDAFAAELQSRTREWEAQRAALEECEAARDRLAAALKDREALLQRAQESEERTQKARAELEERVAAADGALRKQSEEIKRQTQRVHAAEKENTKVAAEGERAHKAVRDAVRRIQTIETALQTLTRRVSSGTAVVTEGENREGAIHRYSHNPMSYYNVYFEESDAECDDRNGDDSAIALVRSDALREELRDDRKALSLRKTKGFRPWLPVSTSRSRSVHAEKVEKKQKPESAHEADDKYAADIVRGHELCTGYIDALTRVFMQLQQRMSSRRRAEKNESTAAAESARLAQHELQAATERQQSVEAQVAVLERERGLLDMQLAASQRDCVELRERAETARLDADAVQSRLRDAESRASAAAEKLSSTEQKLGTAEEKLRAAEENARAAEAKALARLARLTERVKKSDAERESLRAERDAHSLKVKELLLQLQTLRMQQPQPQPKPQPQRRGPPEKAAEKAAAAERESAQRERRAELSALRKELSALRAARESAAARHAKERGGLEAALDAARRAADELRAELSRLQRAATAAEGEAAAQREGEVAALRTMLGMMRDAAESVGEAGRVRQKLFDGSPCGKEAQTESAEQGNGSAVEMRYQAVSLAQRTVLELVRLREVATAAQTAHVELHANASPAANAAIEEKCNEWEQCTVDTFHEAERRAWESAQRSAARRCRPSPVLYSAEKNNYAPPQGTPALQKLLCEGTPRGSPSPPVPTNDRRGVSRLSSQSTAGVSRSRSQRGDVDGSRSPARPPMLRSLSVQ